MVLLRSPALLGATLQGLSKHPVGEAPGPAPLMRQATLRELLYQLLQGRREIDPGGQAASPKPLAVDHNPAQDGGPLQPQAVLLRAPGQQLIDPGAPDLVQPRGQRAALTRRQPEASPPGHQHPPAHPVPHQLHREERIAAAAPLHLSRQSVLQAQQLTHQSGRSVPSRGPTTTLSEPLSSSSSASCACSWGAGRAPRWWR